MHAPNQPPQPHDEGPSEPELRTRFSLGAPSDRGAETDHAAPEAAEDHAPQIWVGSLSDYNNGILHGAWLDANRDTEDLQLAVQAVLDDSPWAARTGEPAEEWGIFDYDNFGAVRLEQHDSLSWVSAVARGIAEHGPAFAAWADVMQDEDMLGGFEAAYQGHYDSVEEYAAQLVDDLGYNQLLDESLPENLRRYVEVDTAALGRDMELGGDVHIIPAEGGGVWIFDAYA